MYVTKKKKKKQQEQCLLQNNIFVRPNWLYALFFGKGSQDTENIFSRIYMYNYLYYKPLQSLSDCLTLNLSSNQSTHALLAIYVSTKTKRFIWISVGIAMPFCNTYVAWRYIVCVCFCGAHATEQKRLSTVFNRQKHKSTKSKSKCFNGSSYKCQKQEEGYPRMQSGLDTMT